MPSLLMIALATPSLVLDEDERVLVCSYNLAGLIQPPSTSPPFRMFPHDLSSERLAVFNDGPTSSAAPSGLSMNDVIDVLQETVHRDVWEREDCSLSEGSTGRPTLRVSAPGHVHEDVRTFLGHLRRGLTTAPQFEVHVYTGSRLPSLGGVLDAEDANRALANLLDQGTVQRVRSSNLTVRANELKNFSSQSLSTYAIDWEVEIAQGAIAYDPVIAQVGVGLEGQLRAFAVAGGYRVDFATRFSHASEIRSRTFNVVGAMGFHREAVHEREMSFSLEHPRSEFATAVGTLMLSPDEVAWIQASTRDFHALIEVRLRDTAENPITQIPTTLGSQNGDEGEPLHIYDLGAIHNSGYTLPGSLEWLAQAVADDLDSEGKWGRGSLLDPTRKRSWLTPTEMVSLVQKNVPDWELDPLVYFRALGNHLLTVADLEIHDEIESILESAPPFETYLAHGIIQSDSKTLAEFRLPLTSDMDAALWSGGAGAYLFDWEVDVANESFVANPVIANFLDGYALQLHLSSPDIGGLDVHVRGLLHFQREPIARRDLGSKETPHREVVSFHSLPIDDVRTSPVESPRPTFRWGDERLSLELTLEKKTPSN